MKYLVSGATGFIGSRLCQRLSERGDTVVALSARGGALADGTPTIAVDLASELPVAELFEGVDVVIHLAGIAHRDAAPVDYERVNHRAAVAMAHLASNAGVHCFIFLSSVKAMGPAVSASPRAEQDCTPPADDYGLSKWRAECALREFCTHGDMGLVILRPALVYGPGARGNLERLATAVSRGLPRPPEGGRRSMIALEDLVELLCNLVADPPQGVHTWIACGPQAYSTRDIYDCLHKVSDRGSWGGWLPRWVWRLGAALLDLLTGRRGESTWQRLFGDELYTSEAVMRARNWHPRGTLEGVMASSVNTAAP